MANIPLILNWLDVADDTAELFICLLPPGHIWFDTVEDMAAVGLVLPPRGTTEHTSFFWPDVTEDMAGFLLVWPG